MLYTPSGVMHGERSGQLAWGLVMLFRSSVRVLLWALLALVVIAVTGYLAIDLGLVDRVYDVGSEAWLNGKKDFLQSKFQAKGESIDRSLKIIGLAFTVVLGTLTFLTGLHYATINLPLRLQEYANRIKQAHLLERPIFFAPYASRNLKGELAPPVKVGFSDRLLSFFRTDATQKPLQRLMQSVSILDGDIRVLSAKLGMCKSQRITAHVIEGLKLSAEARFMQQGSDTQNSKNNEALTAIGKALKLDENDLDALEQAAKLAKLLSLKLPVQEYLDKMERAAQDLKTCLSL